MITLDILRPLALFANLNDSQRAFVVTHAAELTLNTGDYILYQGEEPAFFYILTGCIESTRHSYSQEQFVSTRTANDHLGEVPILMGTATPINARATEPSRVLRLDAHDFR